MADPQVDECFRALSQLSYKDAVIGGTELYSSSRSRVTEHTTASGRKIAVKVRSFRSFHHSEADLLEHAGKSGVKVNTYRGYYDIVTLHPEEPIATVLVSDRLPGQPLDRVWENLSTEQRGAVKKQIQEQFRAMKRCTLPHVGRPGHQGTYNIFRFMAVAQFGPFDTEDAFEHWCLHRVQWILVPPFVWTLILKALKRKEKTRDLFVLTHAHLTPSCVIVDGDRLSGMVSWEHAGFFPPYAEYAFYRKCLGGRELWWRDLLMEQMEPCSKLRLYFTGRIKELEMCWWH